MKRKLARQKSRFGRVSWVVAKCFSGSVVIGKLFFPCSVPNRAKQTPPPTSYSSSEDEEWEDAVDGEDEDDDEEWSTRRERKESAHSQHSQHLVNKSLPALPEDGKSNQFVTLVLLKKKDS